MRVGRPRAIGRTKAIVLAAIVGAVLFSAYLGFLEYTNDSFPVKEKPFADYAVVQATQFNGTELYFKLGWTSSGNFTPMYAQITSPSSDEANSPVCDLGLRSVVKGQTLDLPFGVSAPTTALSSVDLAIAVRANANMTEFTIVYHVAQINAQTGNISPSNYACEQPPAPAP